MNVFEKIKAALLFNRVADRIKEAHMKGGLKVAAFGIAAAVVTGVVGQISMTCPGLIENLPGIVTAGALAGLGLWLKAPKDEPK